MGQIFHPSMNTIAKASIAAGGLVALVAGAVVYLLVESNWNTSQTIARDQPIPFSHEHHVSGLGIDCRFCHTSVENSKFAGVPATKVCMTCHSQIWTNAQLLAPVRQSWRTGTPIQWQRVHNLPGYVYFNHSIHVNKGVGCSTCHGKVQEMALMYQESNLQMQWCLNCHRNPEQYLRPRDQVFNMDWTPPKNQIEMGSKLAEEYHVLPKQQMQNCSTCHR